MKLGTILKNIGKYKIDGPIVENDISHAAWDTRLLRSGGLFVLRSGKRFDPLSKLDSIKSRARVIVADQSLLEKVSAKRSSQENITYVFVEDIKMATDHLVSAFMGQINELRFVGVTGTNGKTTVCNTLKHIFDVNKQKSAVIGTIAYEWDGYLVDAFMTTPDRENFSTLCAHMLSDGVKNVFMEISSHALVKGRVAMINLDAAVFTNLSPEHLDFHETMDKYAKAKNKIHDLLKLEGVAVINKDDEFSSRSTLYVDRKVVSFAIENDADYKASSLKLDSKHIDFSYENNGVMNRVQTNLVGRFNVENCLAAIATANQLGLTKSQIADGLISLKAPCGRLEQVSENVFVDYAHTPDALDKCLSCLKDLGYKKIITIFGCGGDRDKSKRSLMGEVADKYSDFIIVTDDNPRSEDPDEIVEQIGLGIKSTKYEVVHDRQKAIAKGLNRLQQNSYTALLVAGKGHEKSQLRNGKEIYFSDHEVIRELVS